MFCPAAQQQHVPSRCAAARRPLSEQPLISMQRSSNSSSSGGGGGGASTHKEQPAAAPPDPPRDVESAFGSVIFEPGARPAAVVKGCGPVTGSLGARIAEGEEYEPGSAVRRTAARLSLGGGGGGRDSQCGSPVYAGLPPPGDEAGADSRRGSAPSVPPLSPQATPGVHGLRDAAKPVSALP